MPWHAFFRVEVIRGPVPCVASVKIVLQMGAFMSDLLNRMSEGFDRRMAARRHMLDHIGVSLTEEATLLAREDVRATLLACATCRDPELCECWVAQRQDGLPVFCRARDSFLRLAALSGD